MAISDQGGQKARGWWVGRCLEWIGASLGKESPEAFGAHLTLELVEPLL